MYSCFITEGKILLNVLSAVRDGSSSQCEVPRDPRFPECPGKVDVSVSMSYFHFGHDMTESVLTLFKHCFGPDVVGFYTVVKFKKSFYDVINTVSLYVSNYSYRRKIKSQG